MPTADVWLNQRFNNGQPVEALRQATLQTHFIGQLGTVGNATTRRLLKKMYWRVGKLYWRACAELAARQAPHSIQQWRKTNRSTAAEEYLQMNCWEAVLYLAYQCGALSTNKIRRLYTNQGHHAAKLTQLFGTHRDLANPPPAHPPAPGDVLSFFNVNRGEIDHVAIFVGNDAAGTPHLIHNLQWNANTTGIQMGGCIHFETVANTMGLYQANPVTCFYTAPFWQPGSPTHGYAHAL
ncbi:MAG: hypothetical protein KF782_06040 [Labilithrix sp.]|nr:hypothetical protein [Labilithrix sp.]